MVKLFKFLKISLFLNILTCQILFSFNLSYELKTLLNSIINKVESFKNQEQIYLCSKKVRNFLQIVLDIYIKNNSFQLPIFDQSYVKSFSKHSILNLPSFIKVFLHEIKYDFLDRIEKLNDYEKKNIFNQLTTFANSKTFNNCE